MIWFVDMQRSLNPQSDQIGPGRLVLVVGPSGAGKDTLITGARAACADDPSVVFPRRMVTRPSTADEDHDTATEERFRHAVAAGEFALWWEAHGHRYGLPSSIDADIRARKTVVCNVSRTVVGFAQRRYASVAVVLVTAPADVLAERLACRSRTSDGCIQDRIARSAIVGQDAEADVVIHNVGRPQAGIRQLLNVVRDTGIVHIS
jgi:ribose 1,5-bisphosphokinase